MKIIKNEGVVKEDYDDGFNRIVQELKNSDIFKKTFYFKNNALVKVKVNYDEKKINSSYVSSMISDFNKNYGKNLVENVNEEQGGSSLSIITTGKKYIWKLKSSIIELFDVTEKWIYANSEYDQQFYGAPPTSKKTYKLAYIIYFSTEHLEEINVEY